MVDGPLGLHLDLYKYSEHAAVSGLVEALVESLVNAARVRDCSALEAAVRVLCLNLFVVRVAHPDAYLICSFDRGYYTGSPVGYRRLERVVDAFVEWGLIKLEPGRWRGPDRMGRRARIAELPRMVELFARYGIQLHMIRTGWNRPLVVLKDDQKNRMTIPDDQAIRFDLERMKANLRVLNGWIERSFIGLHVEDKTLLEIAIRMSNDPQAPRFLDFSNRFLYRVFNRGSLECGGRFIGGWWQVVPKEYRKHIYMATPDGFRKPCAEIDYTSMHPAIAYAMAGEQLLGDPYQIPSVSEARDDEQRSAIRSVTKRALLTLLNAETLESARKALISDLVRERDREGNGARNGDPYLPTGCPEVDVLFDELKAQNEPIRRYFHSNMSHTFMNIESRVAERVMLRMVDYGVATLPLHDSFLVQNSWKDDLDRIMREEFLAATGAECKVEFDVTEVEFEAQNRPDEENEVIFGWSPVKALVGDRNVFNRMWDEWDAARKPIGSTNAG